MAKQLILNLPQSVLMESFHDFQLRVHVGEEYLLGEWRSSRNPCYKYKIIEKNHLMKSEYWGGFSRHNELYRQRYDLDGVLIDEQYITENHAMMMYSPFLNEGKGYANNFRD